MTVWPAARNSVDAVGDGAVGEREEHGLGVVGDAVVDAQVARGEVRVDAARSGRPCRSRPTSPAIRTCGMEREEADQLRADVPGRADDRDADRVPAAAPGRRAAAAVRAQAAR